MKLYTEEQVRDMLELTNLNVQFDIDSMTPIELPDYQEIINAMENYGIKDFGQRAAFGAGVEFVKQKIEKL